MNINRQNYESILVDYLDGRLSPEDEAELMLFLLKNPDIAEEVEGLQDASINPSKIQYPNKAVLKKQSVQPFGINNEIDYLCIAELEGDINEKEKAVLKTVGETTAKSVDSIANSNLGLLIGLALIIFVFLKFGWDKVFNKKID